MHLKGVSGALATAMVLAACGGPVGSAPASGSRAPSVTPATASAEPTPDRTPPAPSAEATSAAPAWRQLTPAVEGMTPREDHTWTPDADGESAYLFGGRTADGTALSDLWAYDLAADEWRQVATGGSGPAARFGHNATWVDGFGVVIFGGQAGTTFFNDLWAFNPSPGSWSRLPASGAVPVARYGSCAALGPDGRLWISHGFTAENARFADTRAYDFATGAWENETPSGEAPFARCLHACWWTDDDRLALYAGQTTGVPSLDDLWFLSLGPRQATHSWSQAVLEEAPAARNLYAVARLANGTLVFGGGALDGTWLDDTWLLGDDGSASPVEAARRPAGRSGAEMIADLGRGRVLLAGGIGADGALADVWELTLPDG